MTMTLTEMDAWLAGFIDGDGCLRINICKRDWGPGFEIEPMIRIRHATVAGHIDADGCIKIGVQQGKNSLGYGLQPATEITQCDNDRLMAVLQNYCNERDIPCGTHYVSRDKKRSDQYCWRVSGRSNVEELLSPIRDLFVVKQDQVAILLDDIIPLLDNGHHLHKDGFLHVMQAVDRLNSKKGGSRGKYQLEYFEQLWDRTLDEQQTLDQFS